MTSDDASGDETVEETVKEATPEADSAEDTEAAADTEAAEDTVEDTGHDQKPGRLKRLGSRARKTLSGRIVVATLALLVVASLSLLGALYWYSYRPDRATDAAAAKSAVSAASEGTIAVLSYSPDTLDRDFSSAKSHLTGDFLSYYDQFTQQIVAPAAKQKAVKTTAVVLRAAVSELHPDSAVVLLFVNQSTQSKDRPEPTFTNSSVSVTLTKAHDKWLISSFNPV